MIRKATAADIDAIEASYNELFEHERRNGSLTQWIQGLYPTRATAEGGVERGEMYVYYIDDKLAASMILNSHQPAEYYDIPWVYVASDEEVMVIHTLCVPPSMSGRGLGTLMVGFATGFALGAGKRVMRLDTNIQNLPAQRLYQKLGYRLAGSHHSLHEGVLDTTLVYLEYLL